MDRSKVRIHGGPADLGVGGSRGFYREKSSKSTPRKQLGEQPQPMLTVR